MDTSTRKAENNSSYSELALSVDQRRMIELFGLFGADRLGVSPAPIRGFLWKAVREWQLRHQSTVDELEATSPEERLRGAEEVLQTFLGSLLSAFPRNRHAEIRRFVEDGLAEYRRSHNRR